MRYLVNGYKALYNRDERFFEGLRRCSRNVAPHRRLRQGNGNPLLDRRPSARTSDICRDEP